MLLNKKILVMGAGGLLGSHLVPALLKAGAAVIATDISVAHMQQRLYPQGIDNNQPSLLLRECDITDAEQVKQLLLECEGLSGAVNTTYPRNKQYGAHFFDVTAESFNENLSLHLGSSFLFMQQSAAYFRQQQRPFSLVNVASIYGVVAPKFDIYANTPMTMPVEYAAIKSAIIHLGKYAAAYVCDSRFRVNTVSPGGIFDHQPEPFLTAYKAQTHGTGMLDVTEVLGSIIYLLSDSSRYVTGQNIVIDDGFLL
ncbi:oxidoreductase [Vogesella alkaliphila]|uniref:SDR family oxidoreductase n=1 Tax=Vogesella alkaliphila TaxID=1193621 RepID=A0ABQ2YJH4_9NEIS|nr:oxidoreductase [Vogesella alkaliphila]GGX84061.1 SDR family oxidoreductase [Vogesella alkaliphila]